MSAIGSSWASGSWAVPAWAADAWSGTAVTTGIRMLQTGEQNKKDVLNRPMEDLLTGSGYLADGSDFAGFSTPGQILNGDVRSGVGSPEGILSAVVNTQYFQTSGSGGTWVKRLGTDVYGWELLADVPRLALANASPNYNAYGDSFTVGQGATAPLTKGYAQLIAAKLGASITNYGFGGTGALYAVTRVLSFEPVPRTGGFATVMAAFNDVRRGGNGAKTLAKIANCHRAMLAAFFAQTAIAADNGAIAPTGVWNTFPGYAGKASALGGNALIGNTGATLTTTFTGDSVIIGGLYSDQVTFSYNTATVSVDGVVLATINEANGADGLLDSFGYTNTLVPGALVLTGLGSGSHTLLITVTLGPFGVDWIGTLRSPQACAPVLVATIPRMNAAGYAQAPASATDALMAQASEVIVGVVNEFASYPVRLVFPGTLYDLSVGVNADNIHPNDTGHTELAAAFLGKVLGGSGAVLDIATSGFAGSSHLGLNSAASAANTTAYGDNAAASVTNATAIGKNATASGGGTVALGVNATASGGVAVGGSSTAAGINSTVVGSNAAVSGVGALGASSSAFGDAAAASSTNATALGRGTLASADRTTAVGTNASASAARAVALGPSSVASAASAQAFGAQAQATHTFAVVIGDAAVSTAAHQIMLGTSAEYVHAPGDVKVMTVGKGLYVKEGANATMGTAVLVGGTLVVATTKVTATSRIYLTCNIPGGTPGWLQVSARVNGTSFTILSSSGTDTSTIAWLLVEPA